MIERIDRYWGSPLYKEGYSAPSKRSHGLFYRSNLSDDFTGFEKLNASSHLRAIEVQGPIPSPC